MIDTYNHESWSDETDKIAQGYIHEPGDISSKAGGDA